MSRSQVALVLALLTACSGSKTTPDGGSGDTGTTTTPSTTPCAEVTAADDWAWSGSCIGMTMGCEVAVDGCGLTVTCSGMDMGLPESATVDGKDVVFDDGASLSGCTGTVDDADTLTGTCDGGCDWTLER